MNCKNVVPSSPRLVGDQRNGGEMNCKMLCDVRRLSSSPRLVGDQPSAPLLVEPEVRDAEAGDDPCGQDGTRNAEVGVEHE